MSAFDKNSTPEPIVDTDLTERLLEAGEPVSPPADARARMRALLLQRSRVHARVADGSQAPHRSQAEELPAKSQAPFPDALITVRPQESHDWQQVAPGLDKQLLYRAGDCETFLLRLQPGATVPAHDHPVDEECVVIEGEICVAGVTMPRGTFHLAPAGVRHSEITSEWGALLYIKSGHYRAVL